MITKMVVEAGREQEDAFVLVGHPTAAEDTTPASSLSPVAPNSDDDDEDSFVLTDQPEDRVEILKDEMSVDDDDTEASAKEEEDDDDDDDDHQEEEEVAAAALLFSEADLEAMFKAHTKKTTAFFVFLLGMYVLVSMIHIIDYFTPPYSPTEFAQAGFHHHHYLNNEDDNKNQAPSNMLSLEELLKSLDDDEYDDDDDENEIDDDGWFDMDELVNHYYHEEYIKPRKAVQPAETLELLHLGTRAPSKFPTPSSEVVSIEQAPAYSEQPPQIEPLVVGHHHGEDNMIIKSVPIPTIASPWKIVHHYYDGRIEEVEEEKELYYPTTESSPAALLPILFHPVVAAPRLAGAPLPSSSSTSLMAVGLPTAATTEQLLSTPSSSTSSSMMPEVDDIPVRSLIPFATPRKSSPPPALKGQRGRSATTSTDISVPVAPSVAVGRTLMMPNRTATTNMTRDDDDDYYEDTATDAVVKSSALIEITTSNLDAFLRDHDDAFVAFLTPWGVDSKHLKSIWEDFAEEAAQEEIPLAVATVDCWAEGALLCNNHDLKSLPTMRWFHHGERSADYRQRVDRVAARHLMAFAKGRLADLEEAPSLVELSTTTFDDFIQTHSHVFVLFEFNYSDECQQWKPVWKRFANVAKNRELPLSVAKVNCGMHPNLCQRQQVQAMPTMHWYDNGKLSKKEVQVKERSVRSLMKYSKRNLAVARGAKRHDQDRGKQADQLAPPSHRGTRRRCRRRRQYPSPVDTHQAEALTPDNFREFLESREHVFVTFSYPSEAFESIFFEFWHLFNALSPAVPMGLVDCRAHRKLCQYQVVKAYPTMRWYRNSTMVDDYMGNAEDLAGLHQFIQDATTHPEENNDYNAGIMGTNRTFKNFPSMKPMSASLPSRERMEYDAR